jgi:hypothetical protein
MKLRIAALVFAAAFAAAPALGAIAGAYCAPCGDMAHSEAPCTSLSAASCCGEVAPAAPVKSAPEATTLHMLAGTAPSGLAVLPVRAPLAARPDLAASVSALRHSVVRRL